MSKVFVFASHDINDDPGVVTLRVVPHPGGVFHPDEYVRADSTALVTLLQYLGTEEPLASAVRAKVRADENFQFEATVEGWRRVQSWLEEERAKH